MKQQQHRKRQDIARRPKQNSMKVDLPARDVCTTRSVKKKHISFAVIAAAEFHPPVVKNEVLTLYQGPPS